MGAPFYRRQPSTSFINSAITKMSAIQQASGQTFSTILTFKGWVWTGEFRLSTMSVGDEYRRFSIVRFTGHGVVRYFRVGASRPHPNMPFGAWELLDEIK